MNLLRNLWKDESGVILSAEAAVVGTVAVIGLSTGLSVVATSVNEELKDVGFAIRSLDQSYSIPGTQGCCASTAGSSFQQQDIGKSLADLCGVSNTSDRVEKTQKVYHGHEKKHESGKDKKSESKKKKKAESSSERKPEHKI